MKMTQFHRRRKKVQIGVDHIGGRQSEGPWLAGKFLFYSKDSGSPKRQKQRTS